MTTKHEDTLMAVGFLIGAILIITSAFLIFRYWAG